MPSPARYVHALERRLARWHYGVRRRLAGQHDFRPFIVLSRSRTGSNLLASWLADHPAVHMEGEILNHLHGRDPAAVLACAFGAQARGVRAAGFKIFYYHPQDDDAGETWRRLLAWPRLHVLHLRRRNLLRVLASRKIAGREDAWYRLEGAAARAAPVRFRPRELARRLTQSRAWEEEGARRVAALPCLDLVYEDLVAAPAAQFERVTGFLGLEPHPARSRLQRQNDASLRELIANYDELKAAFVGSEWQDLFED